MDNAILILIGVFIIIAIYISVDSKNKENARLEKRLKKSYGKKSKRKYSDDELENIKHYYEETPAWGFAVDDITWDDLNMDEVFKQMNTCNSSIGQEYLYKMLRIVPDNKERLKETDRLAEYFSKNETERFNIQKIFAGFGFVKKISLNDYISYISELKAGSNFIHYMLLFMMVASLAVAAFINTGVGIIAFIAVVIFQVISYYSMKAKVEPYFICITCLVNMVHVANRIKRMNIKELLDYNKTLDDIIKEFAQVLKNSSMLSDSNVNGSLAQIAMDYIRMLTHIDLIKFNNIVRKLSESNTQIYRLMDTLGFIEATIAIASYRKSLVYYTKPEFCERTTGMSVEQVYHPLVEKPVANSIDASRHILLTGSNASGKSTFLRTIAINALLAQTIYTSTSKQYRAPVYRIYSSMSLKDDLGNNDSYYIVEIKALKRILDAVNENKEPVLCFVDEVLRGTNTVERIAASSEILKSLRYKNALVFAATHDIELTSILDSCYDNYHFQEEITDNDIKFNYRLFEGPAVTRNAIKLLEIIGYDKKIVEDAARLSENFMKKGMWSINN